jgi:hypothetical protein
MNTSNPKWDFTLIIDRTFFSSLCEERESPIDEIGSIFTGKIKSTKEYVWGGVKLGGLVSAFGTGIGVLISIAYGFPEGIIWSGVFGLYSSFYTVPAGALIGYIRG